MSAGLTLQPGTEDVYVRASTRLKTQPQGPYGRAREAAVPEDPLFGTRLFVCAKNWILRCSRALNRLKGPCSG